MGLRRNLFPQAPMPRLPVGETDPDDAIDLNDPNDPNDLNEENPA